MSATITYPNGAGQSLGNVLATCAPLTSSGSIWYVSSAIGTDAASPSGKNDAKPLATLKQAITNSASGDIIVLMGGHTETSAADADWDCSGKRLTIVGAGSSGGYPTAKLTCGNVGSVGGQVYFNTSFCTLRNVWMAVRAAANVNARVSMSAPNMRLIDCYFPCDQYDTGPAVEMAASNSHILSGCTFVSVATSRAAQPALGLKQLGTGTFCRLDGCVFDGGAVGFSNPYAADLSSGAYTHFEGESVSLLRGADIKMNASSTGWINVQTCTGGARVDW
jgi:hypothetical protein